MKVKQLGIFLCLFALAWITSPVNAGEQCVTHEGHIRIDSADQLHLLDGVCKINGNLLIFAELKDDIAVPELESVNLINVKAEGIRSVAFPKLTIANNIYIRGNDLKTVDFPVLFRVSATLYVSSPNLIFLHIPALETVGDFYLIHNLSLKYVFSESLSYVEGLTLHDNPQLDEESRTQISSVGTIASPEERQRHIAEQQQLREMRARYLNSLRHTPQTRHRPAYFGTRGLYGMRYPHYYHRFWHTFGYRSFWLWQYPYPYQYYYWNYFF